MIDFDLYLFIYLFDVSMSFTIAARLQFLGYKTKKYKIEKLEKYLSTQIINKIYKIYLLNFFF